MTWGTAQALASWAARLWAPTSLSRFVHGPGIHGSFIGVLPSSYKLETYVSLCQPVLIYGGFTGRPCDH